MDDLGGVVYAYAKEYRDAEKIGQIKFYAQYSHQFKEPEDAQRQRCKRKRRKFQISEICKHNEHNRNHCKYGGLFEAYLQKSGRLINLNRSAGNVWVNRTKVFYICLHLVRRPDVFFWVGIYGKPAGLGL